MNYTTIQISQETRERLARLKRATNETYDELLNALLDLVPQKDEEGQYSEEFRSSLLRGLLDIKGRRTRKLSDVKKRLGIK
ncbi:MAG: hypothetical protein D6769_01805 [Methanobacteriota archaeon]|nr:MAG: hypothetical protein D6769_01805 [Euryarchaeota archaeon]